MRHTGPSAGASSVVWLAVLAGEVSTAAVGPKVGLSMLANGIESWWCEDWRSWSVLASRWQETSGAKAAGTDEVQVSGLTQQPA